jgi:ferrous iron transport protein A
MEKVKTLADLAVGEYGMIAGLVTVGSMRRRFLDVGLSAGTRVMCVGESPFGDPRAYFVRGCKIAIRRTDAKTVLIDNS